MSKNLRTISSQFEVTCLYSIGFTSEAYGELEDFTNKLQKLIEDEVNKLNAELKEKKYRERISFILN